MLSGLTSCNSFDYSIYESAYGIKGTELYCWEISNSNWRCGALAGTNRNKTYEELKTIQEKYPCQLYKMKEIISSYPEDNYISILIIDYPLTMDNYAKAEIPNIDTLNFLRQELGIK